MAQYYQLPQRGVTCIGVDGVEHSVDPETGIVTIEMLTPNLVADLVARGGIAVPGPGGDPPPARAAAPERARAGHAATPGATAPAAAASTNTKGAAS